MSITVVTKIHTPNKPCDHMTALALPTHLSDLIHSNHGSLSHCNESLLRDRASHNDRLRVPPEAGLAKMVVG